MNKIQEVTTYYLQHSAQSSISEMRLSKTLYLCDWFSTLVFNKPITNLKWQFRYCVETHGLLDILKYGQNFQFIESTPYTSKRIDIKSLANSDYSFQHLDETDIKVLSFVINRCDEMYYNELMDFIYSTYPLCEDTMYRELDLFASAQRYHKKNETKLKKDEGNFTFEL